MKNKLVYLSYFLGYYLGLHKICRLFTKKQIVLTYHNVIPDRYFDNAVHLTASGSLPESAFKKQIEYISKHYLVTTKINMPHSIVITFDDGYKNNFDTILPILESYHINAYFFLSLSNLNNKEPLWIDKVLYWFSYVPYGNYEIGTSNYLIKNDTDRLNAYWRLFEEIKTNYTLRYTLTSDLENLYSFSKIKIDPNYFLLRFTGLTDNDIKEMNQKKILVGAHSVYHDMLAKLTLAELNKDFKTCEENIGTIYNTKVMSYPYGGPSQTSQMVFDSAKKYGFTYAFTNSPLVKDTKYSSSRITLPYMTIDKVIISAYLSGYHSFLKSLFKKNEL